MKSLFIFAAGLAVGAVVGACLVKNKVLADAKEEIEEVREYYRNKHQEVKEEQETKVEVEVPQDVNVVKDIVKNNGYTNYNKPEQVNASQYDDPYVIDPSEFGEEEGYDTMTLTYFADGVLTDDVDDVIDEPDVVVGLENLKVFEEFGATAVYVRNDIFKTDYEILRDDWNYSDTNLAEPPFAKEKKPHQL